MTNVGPPPGQPGYGPRDTAQFGPGQGNGPFGPQPGGAPYGSPPDTTYGPPQGYGPPGHAQGHPGQAGPFGPPPPGYGPPPGGPQGPFPPTGRQPLTPQSGGSRKWLIITAIVAVLALGAGAVVAIYAFAGLGGASTPRQAVELMAADLQEGKSFDALTRLHPAERQVATDFSTTLGDELKRLEIIRPDADPTALNSTFSGLRFDPAAEETVREDVVITKLVAGTISVRSGDASVFTDEFLAAAFPGGLPTAPGSTTSDIDIARDMPEGVRVATVRVDGSWYVSAFYTAADYALREQGLAWPATSVPARGAASAADALEQTLKAAAGGDLRRVIELTPASELQVLHDVGEVLITEAGPPSSPAEVTEVVTSEVSVAGGVGLKIDRLTVTAEGETAAIRRDGDCLLVTPPGQGEQRFCSFTDFFGSGGSSGTGSATLDRVLVKLFPVVTNPTVVVVEENGEFFVSPSKTILDLYVGALRTLDAEDVRTLLREVRGN